METPAEIEAMLQDTGGVEVVLGGDSTWGHHDTTAEQLEAPGLTDRLGSREIVTIATGMLPGVQRLSAITVGGEPRKVHDLVPEADGMTRLLVTP